jgi:hypothetical protein
VSFAHVADLHLPPHPADTWEEPYRSAIDWWNQVFNRPQDTVPSMLAEIQAAEVDFVFLGGDLLDCYDSGAAEQLLGSIRERGLQPYFQVGNHDWEPLEIRYRTHHYDAQLRARNTESVIRRWGMSAPHYSFQCQEVRFLSLDSAYLPTEDGWSGVFDDEQTEWLMDQLTYEGPIVLFHHVPFNLPTLEFRLRSIWGGKLACLAEDPNGRRIRSAVEGCTNVLGTFAAHAHMESEDVLGRTCQFLAPPGHDGRWRLVRIGKGSPPKSLQIEGVPEIP